MRPEMGMILGPRINMDLRLAPQIIQSIEILQLSTLELIDLIKQEREENPILDLDGGSDLEQPIPEAAETSADRGPSVDGEAPLTLDNEQREFENLESFERDERFNEAVYDPPPTKKFDGEDKKQEALQNTAAKSQTLQEYLFEQINLLDLTPMQRQIGEQIVFNIDDNGYLRYRLENIVDDLPRDWMLSQAALAAGAKALKASQSQSQSPHDTAHANGNGVVAGAGKSVSSKRNAVLADAPLAEAPSATSSAYPPATTESPSIAAAGSADAQTTPNLDSATPNSGDRPASRTENSTSSTTSGRFKKRRREEADADFEPVVDSIPLAPPALQPFKHPHDLYYFALLHEASEVLAIIRTLDPPGIGAYDLRECLLLQVTPDMEHAPLLRILIERHLDDLKKNRLPKIAKDTNRSLEEVKAAMSSLAYLNPRPGSGFVVKDSQYVIPDVVVREVEGQYEVMIEDRYIPNLRISNPYEKYTTAMSAPEKDYFKKKLESARNLQLAIEQRRSTLQRVAQAIVETQKNFFTQGVTGLVPLKMQEIADKLGMHVSTVSRAVNDKYMETPRGIFPMKYFFRGGTQMASGSEENTEIVKQRVKQIIEAEPGDAPLSDDEIAAKLTSEFGYDIARRTVTKYRKLQNIPSSRERRRY